MYGEWQVWNCSKIPWMEAKIQPHRYFVPHVTCPSLVTDVTKPRTPSGLLRERQEWCYRKILLMGTKIQLRRYFSLQVQCPSSRNHKNQTLFYGKGRVKGGKSEVNCWNGRWITDLSMRKENIIYSKSYILSHQYIPHLKFQSLSVI